MSNYKIILFAILSLSSKIAFSQITATTEFGKKVILYSNGTWEYNNVKNENYSNPQNHIMLNDKRLISGETTVIHGKNSLYGSSSEIITSVTVAKDNDKTLILIWQEVEFFPLELWDGNVKLYLEDNSIITLIDRNIKGKNTIKGGAINDEVNQIFAVYYLSAQDRLKLKKSNLSRITYRTKWENSTQIIDVNQNYNTLKEQLLEINR